MIFAGNWKLNLGPKAAEDFFNEFKKAEISEEIQKQCYFFPQNLSLSAAMNAANGLSVNLGSQNIASEKSGAFTGENSLEVLEELNLPYCLIGHSERRSLFKEDLNDIRAKMNLLNSSKVSAILCIGESLEERESGRTNEVLKEQLETALLEVPESKEFILAYEPVWAIGTGKVASPEMAEEAHLFVRNFLKEKYSEEKSKSTAILYGGSVKPESSKGLSQMPNIDGFLIGGASLKVDSFKGIIDNSEA